MTEQDGLAISFSATTRRPAEDAAHVQEILLDLKPDIREAGDSLRRFLAPYLMIAEPVDAHYRVSTLLSNGVEATVTLMSDKRIPSALVDVIVEAAFARVFRELMYLDETIDLTKRTMQVLDEVFTDRLNDLMNEKPPTLWERFTVWLSEWLGSK